MVNEMGKNLSLFISGIGFVFFFIYIFVDLYRRGHSFISCFLKALGFVVLFLLLLFVFFSMVYYLSFVLPGVWNL